MALSNSPLLLDTDQFLLSRENATFKIPFNALAGNVLSFIIDPDQDGSNNSNLELNLLADVDTDLYIKERDPDTGAPTVVGSRDADGVKFEDKFWLLQAVNSKVANEVTGESAEEQFVLADAANIFGKLTGDLGDLINNLELNSLLDVTTRTGQTGNFLPHTAGDSFLLCIEEAASSSTGLPDYQPRSLSGKINELVQEPGGIEIHLDSLVDVNPIFNPSVDGPTAVALRLDVTDGYKKGTSDEKYYVTTANKEDDDILVYITDGSPLIDYTSGEGLNATEIAAFVDKDGVSIGSTLPAGWYYAEALFGGLNTLEIADVIDNVTTIVPHFEDDGTTETPEAQADINNVTRTNLGGVRVLPNKDATVEEDDINGGYRLKTAGSIPSNIGITDQGVIYSEIPQTLSFVKTIEIAGSEPLLPGQDPNDPLVERFGTTETFGVDRNTGVDSNTVLVDEAGPGSSLTPEVWADPNDLPTTGDFYVITFVEDASLVAGAGREAGDKKVLKWNDYYPDTSVGNTNHTQDGPDLEVRNGDIVVFGESVWSIMGTVNTDSVAQDLQSVTERGFTTDRPIKLLGKGGDVNNGLIVGQPVNFENPVTAVVLTNGGSIAAENLQVNKIDFEYIDELPLLPNALPTP